MTWLHVAWLVESSASPRSGELQLDMVVGWVRVSGSVDRLIGRSFGVRLFCKVFCEMLGIAD
jgi:hypothetical protein